MSPERRILVVPRGALPAAWLPREGALGLSWDALVEGLVAAGPAWLPRPQAEEDPAWKQPIPYLMVRDAEGRVAVYRRAGTEARLHGQWSVGIGGHVEPADARASPGAGEILDVGATLRACARRELAEELPGCAAEASFLGVINEEVTPVGAVHWGLVFLVDVAAHPSPGPELADLHWEAPARARELALERWSRLALSLLPEHPEGAAAPGPAP